ncbi:MAG: tRNA (adenosine(37)-N6)-threonylcarbamoyltransferase complex dimerization subunit type 1 TsaB [Planctomycetota bacterium]
MKIIGIETSSIRGGVAILEMRNNSVARQKGLALKRGLVHGKLLVPALDKLLKEAHWRKDDLELVAVDIGPGSYTGLRVGLAIAKTISYALKTKIVGVSSLDVLLKNTDKIGAYKYICPVIDARWNQVYAAIYEKSVDGHKRMTDYLAISPEDLLKLINRYKGAMLLLGDGLRAYEDVFKRLANRAEFAPEHFWSPRAENVAILGYESYKAGKRDDPIKLLPLYLRPTEAEINLKIKRGSVAVGVAP